MEARTANSTVNEIYQIISGGTGEPGNWNGAEPVRAYVASSQALVQSMREALGQLVRCEYESAEPGMCDCVDNHGKPYQSQHLALSIAAAESALAQASP
jgi:hypothetical protein